MRIYIYDNPNHPQYGPVRRLWVILVQLDLLEVADEPGLFRSSWDDALAKIVQNHDESSAQSAVLDAILRSMD